MKSEIFSSAIHNRNRIKFLYMFNEVTLEPYLISTEKTGKKVIYGKLAYSNEFKKFEYKNIANIKVIENYKYTPVLFV